MECESEGLGLDTSDKNQIYFSEKAERKVGLILCNALRRGVYLFESGLRNKPIVLSLMSKSNNYTFMSFS